MSALSVDGEYLRDASNCFEASPPGNAQIPTLDAYFSSAATQPSGLPALTSFNRGDVIEIQGPPASGKSHLLYYLLITCIMPQHYQSTNLGGWGKAAILFDTENSFDIRRFNTLLVSRLTRLLSSVFDTTPDIVQSVADKSLTRLHIFRPTSSVHLAASIIHLPKYHTDVLPDAEIGMISIDSVSSFYWVDRFTVEQMRSAQSNTTYVSPLQHVLTALQSFRITHGHVTVLNNWGLNHNIGPDSSSTAQFYVQHLHPFPAPFNNPHAASAPDASSSLSLTHHITLSCAAVPQLPRECTLDEISQLDERRKELVVRGRMIGIVRTPGHPTTGRFTFFIGSNDILVE